MMETVTARRRGWVFWDLTDLKTEFNTSNRCVRCGFVYSASINLLRLLWALVSPSLLGRRSRPAKEQRHGAERSDAFCVAIPICLRFRDEKEAAVPPHRKCQSDTYRNTWLSRGS